MKKPPLVLVSVIVVLAAFLAVTWHKLTQMEQRLAAIDARGADPFHLGLGEVMGYQQRWVDKLGLAAQAGNWTAAAFYADELKETADDIIAAAVVRDNQNVSELVKTSLLPAIEGVTDAVERKSAPMFMTRYSNLVSSCNACHGVAKVPFIHITAADDARGRWNQDFSRADIEK
jgi:hypothetical protein